MTVRKLPLWVRRAIVDAIEGSVAAVGGLALVYPVDVTSAKQQAIIVGVAILGAVLAAARRAVSSRFVEKATDKVLGDEVETPAADPAPSELEADDK